MREQQTEEKIICDCKEIGELDEPAAGLDLKERINFKQFISEYVLDKIVIFATHIVSDIEEQSYIVKDVIHPYHKRAKTMNKKQEQQKKPAVAKVKKHRTNSKEHGK